jgi:hypothetical protein
LGLIGVKLGLIRVKSGLTRVKLGLIGVKLGLIRVKSGLTRVKLGLIGVKLGLIRVKSGLTITQLTRELRQVSSSNPTLWLPTDPTPEGPKEAGSAGEWHMGTFRGSLCCYFALWSWTLPTTPGSTNFSHPSPSTFETPKGKMYRVGGAAFELAPQHK